MKFTATLLAALVVAVSAAPYTPPADQPDGVYHVTFDEAGEPVTRRLVTDATAGSAGTSKLEAREQPFPGQQVSCTNRNIPQNGDYGKVQTCLSNWLDANSGRISGNNVYYCRSGDALLAICNYAGEVYGSSSEISRFNGIMDDSCARWRSGYIFIKDWNKTYWRTTWGESICDNLGNNRQQVY